MFEEWPFLVYHRSQRWLLGFSLSGMWYHWPENFKRKSTFVRSDDWIHLDLLKYLWDICIWIFILCVSENFESSDLNTKNIHYFKQKQNKNLSILNKHCKVSGYKMNIQKSMDSIHWQWTIWKEIKEIIPFYNSIKNNKMLRNKFKHGNVISIHRKP